VAFLRSQLARGHYFMGNARLAVQESDRVLEIAEHDDLTGLLADTLVTKGSALASLGRVREGIGVIRTGGEVARDSGHTAILLRALRNQSVFQAFEVEASTSRARNEELLELARRIGDRSTLLDTAQTIGWLEALYGLDTERAIATWSETLAGSPEPADEAPNLDSIVTLRSWRGEASPDLLARLDELAAALSEPSFRTMPDSVRGWIALSEGRLAEARRHWEARIAAYPEQDTLLAFWCGRAGLWEGDPESVAVGIERVAASGVHLPATELRRRSLAAGLAGLRGDPAEAAAGYRLVLDGWRRLGHLYEEAFTAIDMATILGPEHEEVRQAAERARDIFGRMGAKPFLERLEALTARVPSSTRPAAEVPAAGPAR
jgi:hypothetical protein